MFCLTLAPSDDLVNALLRNTEGLRDAGPSFPRFIPCDNFGVSVDFFRRVVGLRSLREWGVVEHLDDVKRGQPNIEASCGVEAPIGRLGQAIPLFERRGILSKMSVIVG